MKAFLSLILFLLIKPGFAQIAPQTDKASTHGMFLMGTTAIYAGHLPMFHSPHDYQIILELEFSADDKAAYLADRKAHPEEVIYTLEPEHFVLPEMVNNTKVFKASIYRGHFERGGTAFIKNIEVKIKKTVYYKRFDPKEKKSEKLKYIMFGNDDEQFLAHKISAKPDFDEYIAVTARPKAFVAALHVIPYLTVLFPETDQRKPFSWKAAEGTVEGSKESISFENNHQLYLEYNDLN